MGFQGENMGHTKQNNLKGTIYTRHLLGNLINDMPFEDYINEPDFIHSSEVKLSLNTYPDLRNKSGVGGVKLSLHFK